MTTPASPELLPLCSCGFGFFLLFPITEPFIQARSIYTLFFCSCLPKQQAVPKPMNSNEQAPRSLRAANIFSLISALSLHPKVSIKFMTQGETVNKSHTNGNKRGIETIANEESSRTTGTKLTRLLHYGLVQHTCFTEWYCVQGKILDLSGNYSRRKRQAVGNEHHFVPKTILKIRERVDGSSYFLVRI